MTERLATISLPGRVATLVVVVLVLSMLVMLLPAISIYRDWGFICENTGSFKGYRRWVFGIRTGHWYRQSTLEKFLIAKHPEKLQHRWTSYAGTGHNIFGRAVLYGHGRPGAIMRANTAVLDQYTDNLSEADKLALYHLLLSDDQKQIEAEVSKMWDQAGASAGGRDR